MDELRELYQEVILDHSKRPRNFGKLDSATHSADGDNPLCGDKIRVELELDGDVVVQARFEGVGCAISMASASLMTETLRGKSIEQAKALFHQMHETCTGQSDSLETGHESVELGKLVVFEGVRQYPLRVKCATLAWHTMRNALVGSAEDAETAVEVVTTE